MAAIGAGRMVIANPWTAPRRRSSAAILGYADRQPHPERAAMGYAIPIEETIEIAACPDAVYATIVDVERWGRFSPECIGATVTHTDGPLVVGGRFSGHNRRGALRRWSTQCTVTAAEPSRLFTFDSAAIGLRIATWSYRLEPVDEGRATRLTQTWRDSRGRLMKAIGLIVSGVHDRGTHNRESMRITNLRLKIHLEALASDHSL
jgi:polyketide cyclase/dehydrase/lipid transport protein